MAGTPAHILVAVCAEPDPLPLYSASEQSLKINSKATVVVVLALSLWYATPCQATNASTAQEATPQPRCCAPLVVPNAPDAEVTFSAPVVSFDLDGDGTQELVAFPENGAWLALDINKNGVIDDGRELIGQMTGGNRVPTGFESLKIYVYVDGQGQVLTENSGLLLWRDANHDGVSQPPELQPASSVLDYILLGYTTSEKKDRFGTFVWMKGGAIYGGEKEWPVYVVFPATQ